MKIAVIGSGISGLSASYFLSKKHHVDLFEKEDRFGGHSYTIDVIENKKRIPVDIGFIVFNHLTYPNLINFFEGYPTKTVILDVSALSKVMNKVESISELLTFFTNSPLEKIKTN